MKILMTADTVGGVWTYALELVRALQAWPCEVALATMGAPLSATQWAEANALGNLTIYESNYRLEWMVDPWDDVIAAGAWLLGLQQQLRPDLIHLNNYAHGVLPWRAPVVMVGHSCVLSWWQAVNGTTAPPEWRRYRQIVGAGLRHANSVVAPSQAMLRALQWHYGPLRAACVIYNGRRAELFQAQPKEPMILTVGRLWDKAKNLQVLATVAPQLRWPVYGAGATRDPGQHDDHTVTAAVGGVQPLGQLVPTAVAHWMGRAAIYALPACYEPFGLSALEAALSHCALVLGDIPSLREIWGDAACWVEPHDQAGLMATLDALIAVPATRRALANQAYHRAQRYRAVRMGAAYWRLYNRLTMLQRQPNLAWPRPRTTVALAAD